VLSANEGDARDWPGISSNGEELRRARAVADLALFPDAADNARLGRLNVTPFAPATSGGGKLTSLYSLGSRSISIRTEGGDLVWWATRSPAPSTSGASRARRRVRSLP